MLSDHTADSHGLERTVPDVRAETRKHEIRQIEGHFTERKGRMFWYLGASSLIVTVTTSSQPPGD